MNLLKRFLMNSAFLSMLTSKTYAIFSHFLSIPWRIKALFICHVSIGAKIIGWKSICLGRNSVISAGTWININHRGNGIQFSIGNNSFIGRDNFFTVGNNISIGPYCLTASNCSFIGSSHVIVDPLKPYLTTGVTDHWSITVGANCFFGYGASVIGNVVIGHGCVIGAHCQVKSDIPPFSMVVGNPAVVVKRYDFKEKKWTKDFDKPDFEVGLNEIEYIEGLKRNLNGKFPFMPISVSNCLFGDAI